MMMAEVTARVTEYVWGPLSMRERGEEDKDDEDEGKKISWEDVWVYKQALCLSEKEKNKKTTTTK